MEGKRIQGKQKAGRRGKARTREFGERNRSSYLLRGADMIPSEIVRW